jgi:hypothetical protein
MEWAGQFICLCGVGGLRRTKVNTDEILLSNVKCPLSDISNTGICLMAKPLVLKTAMAWYEIYSFLHVHFGCSSCILPFDSIFKIERTPVFFKKYFIFQILQPLLVLTVKQLHVDSCAVRAGLFHKIVVVQRVFIVYNYSDFSFLGYFMMPNRLLSSNKSTN